MLSVVSLASVTAAWAAVDVRQMSDDTIVNGNTLRCEQNALGNYGLENSYYRRFHLPDYGVTGPFTVTGVTFAVDIASDGADAGQPVAVRIHTLPAGSPLLLANLTLDDSEDLSIADSDAGTLKSAPFSSTVAHPNSTDLVLELFQPNGVAGSNRLVFGSNETTESRTGYWRAPDCSYFEPTPLNSSDFDAFPLQHIILLATGDEGADVDPPNLKVQIPGGQTLAGARNKGVKARLSSGEPCALHAKLLISKKLAHRLGIPRLVGESHAALANAGRRTVATNFTRKAKRALRGRAHLALVVRVTATDPAHNAKTVSKSVTL